MPLRRLAATITATELISQRCKKVLNAEDISFSRSPAWEALSHFFQPLELVREEVFRGDSVVRLPRSIVLLSFEAKFKPGEVERVGLLGAEFICIDRLEHSFRFILALIHQKRQRMVDFCGIGVRKSAEEL